MTIKVISIIIFLLGLIYLIWPGPSSVNDFAPIPDSLKSDEPGDTTQVSNLSAYFSQMKRDEITRYYKDQFSYLNIFGVKIPSISFNYPVEESKLRVRDQIQTTFIEEYSYPLRDSLYVNGFDKLVWNELQHNSTDEKYSKILIGDSLFNSKTTIRYYGSSVIWRLVIYFGIWVCLIALFKISAKVFRKN